MTRQREKKKKSDPKGKKPQRRVHPSQKTFFGKKRQLKGKTKRLKNTQQLKSERNSRRDAVNCKKKKKDQREKLKKYGGGDRVNSQGKLEGNPKAPFLPKRIFSGGGS